MIFKFLKHAGHVVDFGRTGLILLGAALGQHNGRHRDHRAMRVSQHLVHGTGAGDGGKVGRAMSTQHDEVSLLGSALVEQFLCRIAERHTCLYTDLALQLGWNQGGQLGLNLVDSPVGEDLGALLGRDDLLQDQAGVVHGGQFRAKVRHHLAGLLLADFT